MFWIPTNKPLLLEMQIPRQAQVVQKQIKKELCMMGSLKGDPLGQYQFHYPLFASVWSVVRESAVVPNVFSRGVKELLGAAVSRGNLCRFCCCWHSNTACEVGVPGMREAWRNSTLTRLSHCDARIKAIMLWFRDATHPGYFEDYVCFCSCRILRT
jgi:AhpD family alkylhydroperoxidase